MARLTIRQASQQGFASTLAIHRHIKEGLLPVYEEGDAMLIEVDDLIAVFGEPAARRTAAAPAPTNGPVDMREFNRIKAELDQKNKKNMWLAADLAEVVRELKEKEARFEKERNRLLTVLEQAQTLLLREVERSGGTRTAAETEAQPEEAVVPNGITADAPGATPLVPDTPDAQSAAIAAPAPAMPETNESPPQLAESEEPLVLQSWLDATQPEPGHADANGMGKDVIAGLPPIPPEGGDDKDSDLEQSVNPLIPPIEDPAASRHGRRMLGATTWLLLFTLAGGGFVFFEFRTKVMMSLNKVLQALS